MLQFAVCVLLLCIGTTHVHAAYPERPIRIVVPVAAGGGNDIVARLLAKKLTEKWNQQVVVDNRPGASTAIGAEIVARAAPDGYTIMFHSASFAINAAMQRKLPFDPIKDFVPIGLVARVPQILVVNPAFPAKTLGEFLAQAKARPGQINFASAGAGSSPHLAMEMLMEMAGVSLNHIPYKGTAPGMTDLVAGQVHMSFSGISSSRQLVDAGKLRAIALTGAQRNPAMPSASSLQFSKPCARAATPSQTVRRFGSSISRSTPSLPSRPCCG